MALPDLIELEELKDALGIPATDTSQDTRLASAITRASAAIRSHVERAIGAPETAATKTYRYDGSGWLEIDDATAITSVSIDGVVQTEGYDYVAGPDRPLSFDSGLIYSWIELHPGMGQSPEMGFTRNLDTLHLYGVRKRYYTVSVTGTFGFPTIPSDVKQAAIWTAVHFSSAPQPYDQAQISQYSFEQDRALAEAIPARAKELLAPFKRGLH